MTARRFLLLGLVLLLILSPAPAVAAPPAHPGSLRHLETPSGLPPVAVSRVSPAPGSTVYTQTPLIQAWYNGTTGSISPSGIDIVVDGIDVTGTGDVTITPVNLTYTVPSILKLPAGNTTVNITFTLSPSSTFLYSWGFNVSTSAPPTSPTAVLSGSTVLLVVALGAAVAGAIFGGVYGYLRKSRKFTFHKYFATHPIQKEYLTLYLPLLAAFLSVLFLLSWVFTNPQLPWFAFDTVLLVGLFVALTTYGLDARRELSHIRDYESAFAQFLFEMADALRGGIDPAKAIIELSKTETNIMAKPLRIAADGLAIGRSFDAVLRDMAKPMKSPLISRYAALIADAATVGGESTAVMYRAAKDMDDFIKIEKERAQKLTLPIGVVYISFGVLIAVLIALLDLAPSLGSLNFSVIQVGSFGSSSSGSTSGAALPAQVQPLSFPALRERFLELSMMVGLGNGALIGAFSEGKPKYGIPHALVMAAAVLVVFAIWYP